MKIWKDGDERTRSARAASAGRTSFTRGGCELEDPKVEIPDVLVAVCRECDGIAAIPHQSTPRLRTGIERPKETLNVRLPAHLLDVSRFGSTSGLRERVAERPQCVKEDVLDDHAPELAKNMQRTLTAVG